MYHLTLICTFSFLFFCKIFRIAMLGITSKNGCIWVRIAKNFHRSRVSFSQFSNLILKLLLCLTYSLQLAYSWIKSWLLKSHCTKHKIFYWIHRNDSKSRLFTTKSKLQEWIWCQSVDKFQIFFLIYDVNFNKSDDDVK